MNSVNLDFWLQLVDELVQHVVILFVYQYEYLILPLATLLIVVGKKRRWLQPLRWPLLMLFIIYVAAFQMHWYSAIALPLLIGILFSDVLRDRWYRALQAVPRSLRRPEASELRADQRNTRRHQWISWAALASTTLVALIAVGFHWDLLAMLLAGLLGAAALVVLLPWGGWAETWMEAELAADPCLGRHLDWLRWVRLPRPDGQASYLAPHRIQSPPAAFRQVTDYPRLRRLLRLVASRLKLGNVGSCFVLQCVARARDEAWVAWSKSLAASPAPLDPFSETPSCREQRWRWLALTQALAECHVFSGTVDPTDSAGRPDWIIAAELLVEAAEHEHQRLRDMVDRAARPGQDDDAIDQQRRLTALLFDLASGCVERHLDPSFVGRSDSLEERWKRFVEEAPATDQRASDVRDPAEAWRETLMRRYQLLQAFAQGGQRMTGVSILTTPLAAGTEGVAGSLEPFLATCARDASATSLLLELRLGDPVGRMVFDDAKLWSDRLAQADRRYVEAERLDRGDSSLRGPATHAVGRVLDLWGQSVEQDLAVLRDGSSMWRERLEHAADLYSSCRSRKILRLSAIDGARGRTRPERSDPALLEIW